MEKCCSKSRLAMASPLNGSRETRSPDAMMTSSIFSAGSPAFRPTTRPSQRPSSMNEIDAVADELHRGGLADVAAVDRLRAHGHEHGQQLLVDLAAPPVMNRSVPFSAPFFEPVIGRLEEHRRRSREGLRHALRELGGDGRATRRSRNPGRAPARMPVLREDESLDRGGIGQARDHDVRHLGQRLRRRRDRGPGPHEGRERSAVRFQTVRGNPLSRRLRAMRPPMRPSPANPMRCCMGQAYQAPLSARPGSPS